MSSPEVVGGGAVPLDDGVPVTVASNPTLGGPSALRIGRSVRPSGPNAWTSRTVVGTAAYGGAMAKVSIVGGHGKVALRLARLLVQRGDAVTSWVRNLDHVAEVEATGAAVLVADVESMNLDDLTLALAGAEAVVWSAGAGGGSVERTYAVDRDAAIRSMDAAEIAQVGRYVMVSYFYDKPDHGVSQDNPFFAYADAKASADKALRDSELDWVILGPSGLTDDPGTGGIETGAGVAPSHVSRDDVAAVAAHVLATPSISRVTIDFNGGPTPVADAI